MKRTIFFLIALIAAGIFPLAGFARHGGHGEHSSSSEMMQHETMHQQAGNVWTTAEGTEYFTCPVMRGEGKVENAVSFSDIDEVRYYHCCPGCEQPFQGNPERYLNSLYLPANVDHLNDAGEKVFVDPVNGEEGVVNDETLHADHMHQRYFFTSTETKTTFEENPSRYMMDEMHDREGMHGMEMQH